MSKANFAKTIISKLKDSIGTDGGSFTSGSATQAMTAVAEGITEYLIDHTKVTVSYAGVIPGTPPVNDPLTSDTFKITGKCAPTGPSNSFDAWIKLIETNIIAGFSLATTGEKGLAFPAKPFLTPGITTTQSNLKSTHKVDDEDPQQKVWEVVCGGIMDWINNTAKNPTPGTGSNSATQSKGTAKITAIKIT